MQNLKFFTVLHPSYYFFHPVQPMRFFHLKVFLKEKSSKISNLYYFGKIWTFYWTVTILIWPLPISFLLKLNLFNFLKNVYSLIDGIIVSLMQVHFFRHFLQIFKDVDVTSILSSPSVFFCSFFISCKDILYSKNISNFTANYFSKYSFF